MFCASLGILVCLYTKQALDSKPFSLPFQNKLIFCRLNKTTCGIILFSSWLNAALDPA
jgi:hypothetical protein